MIFNHFGAGLGGDCGCVKSNLSGSSALASSARSPNGQHNHRATTGAEIGFTRKTPDSERKCPQTCWFPRGAWEPAGLRHSMAPSLLLTRLVLLRLALAADCYRITPAVRRDTQADRLGLAIR